MEKRAGAVSTGLIQGDMGGRGGLHGRTAYHIAFGPKVFTY